MLLGGIGDDFTGSGDLANTLARQGMRTVQYCGIPDTAADPNVEAGVVSLKSRTISASLAVKHALAALDWLLAQGCQQIIFKYCSTFDSTPDGNIGPVVAALAERMNAHRVIVCPAFPAAGRTLFQGHLFVADHLLSESGMRDHPLTPMTDPDIRRWLARQTNMPVGHVPHDVVRKGASEIRAALETEDAHSRRLIVVDATSEDDLLEIGQAANDLSLITGGSGVAMGLPANFRARGLLQEDIDDWQGTTGPCVVLSGSCSVMTRKQVATHLKDNTGLAIDIASVLSGDTTAQSVSDWLMSQDGLPIAYSTTDPETIRSVQSRYGRDRAASAIERLFAQVALKVVAAGATRLITAGGETSGAVVEALAPKILKIGPEIAPGVPALRAENLALALKSGNFGAADFFAKASRILEQT